MKIKPGLMENCGPKTQVALKKEDEAPEDCFGGNGNAGSRDMEDCWLCAESLVRRGFRKLDFDIPGVEGYVQPPAACTGTFS